MSVQSVVLLNLNVLKSDIQEALNLARKEGRKINNTNKASDSLRSLKLNETNYQLKAIEYLEFLNKGRGAGKFPNLGSLKEWVQTKLGITDEKEIESVAFLVGRKIAKEGTEIFNDNSQGIELEKLILKMRKKLTKDLSSEVVLQITQKLNKFALNRKK